MKKLFFFILMPIAGFTQDGPAGVGNIQGKSSLVIWLNANNINQDTTSHVGLWLDNSGYGNNAHMEAGLGPTLYHNWINHNKSLNFDAKRHEYLIISSNPKIKGNELSLYVIGKIKPESSPWAGFLLKQTGSSWNDGYGIGRNDNEKEFIGYTNDFEKYGLKAPFEFNENLILSLHHSNDSLKFYKNGKNVGMKEHQGIINQNDDVLWIGWTGENLDGEIAELIMYNKSNSLIQKRLIHNYLSTKYDINIEEDLFVYDDSIHGDFDYDLAGIGMAEDKSLQLDAQSNGMVYINNPSNLDLDEYMIWAHNGLALELTNISDIPEGTAVRLNRVWRVSETDLSGSSVDLGSVDIKFDLSKLSFINSQDLFLLIDRNNDGLFSNEEPIAITDLFEGRILSFKNITDIENGSRFTLCSSDNKRNNLKPFLNYFEISFSDSLINVNWNFREVGDFKSIILQKTDNLDMNNILSIIHLDEKAGNEKEFSYIDKNPSEFYTVYQLLCLKSNNDTIKLSEIGLDYAFEKVKYEQQMNQDLRMELMEDLARKEKEKKQFYMYFGIIVFVFLSLLIYFKKRSMRTKNERNELFQQIENLKQKGAAGSLAEPENRNELKLDRKKLEQSIDAKIGESSWRIINLIFIKPSISNKEIAEEVSLSLEGVSSSLRKMYLLFNITTSSNKKIALLMEVIKISSIS